MSRSSVVIEKEPVRIQKYNKEIEREKINQKAVQLSLEHKHLILEHPTGTGKGLRAAECIRASKSKKKWIVCVPEIAQIENYKQDLEKFNNSDLLNDKIEDIICYASLKNYANSSYNLHMNEVHRLSDFRYEVVKTINSDQIISDSATINEEIKSKLWDISPYFLYTITLEEAIKLNVLPQPTIYLIGCEFDNTKKEFTFKFNAKKSVSNLTEQEYYDKLCESIKYWQDEYNAGNQIWQRNKMLQLSMERKRFMGRSKTERAKKLLQELDKKGKRYICFCSSIAQAKELGGKKAISSKDTKNENFRIIEEFNSKKSNSIFSCAMGVEGMNFFAIDSGVIIQLDREERLPIQKIGRILRSSEPEIYILYIKNSQDEKYLNEFLDNSHIDNQFIKYI